MNSMARITAIGTCVPEARLTNADFEKMVDTNDEWIVQRTGIKERRVTGENEFASDLAIGAVRSLAQRFEAKLEDVDCIIVSTTTADYAFPSIACQIQRHFGIAQTASFDLNATCAGFSYSLHLANGLVTSGLHRKVLVVATETLTKVTDYTDRSTCILFGDGAGAALIERDELNPGFIAAHLGTNGEGGDHLYRTNLSKTLNGAAMTGNGTIYQNGREVYKWAVRTVPEGIQRVLDKAGMTSRDVNWFVPHSANLRMIESICEKSGIGIDQTLVSVEYFGNTSSASIPLALDLGVKDGKLKNGDTVLLYGFGGGLTHAGLLLKWSLNPENRESH